MTEKKDNFQLYNLLSNKAHPLFIFNDTIIPSATIWVGVRSWSKYFRELGLESGDRIILSLPESPAFVHILFASIWEKLTLIILKPDNMNLSQIKNLDVKLLISQNHYPFSVKPDEMGMPPEKIGLRISDSEKTPSIRFILQSSGSTGEPKFICLTEEGVLSVIESHRKVFQSFPKKEHIVLSILPWSHCFGLVLDLLLSVFCSESIFRDPDNGKNINSIVSLWKKNDITHLSGVPLTFERILNHSNGKELLHSLRSGIVGGAPISRLLAEELAHTNLCIGYGQTEASPGICLGEKSLFLPNYIGNPLGCEIKISEQGELLFKGKNSLYAYWKNKEIFTIPPNSWIHTGDLVERRDQGLFFIGRLDFSFKLPSGIMVQPELVEESLKEKIKSISNCLLFYSSGVHLLLSIDSLESRERIIKVIHESIPSLLKKSSIYIQIIDSSEWIFSPKGGISRKAMIEKFLNT